MSWQPPKNSRSTLVPVRTRIPRGGTAPRIVLSGTAQVCCVHDREKRRVVTEAQVAAFAPHAIGRDYDPRQDKLHLCSCCENLFVDPSDEPRFCSVCVRPLVHPLGGPLPEPQGVVDG